MYLFKTRRLGLRPLKSGDVSSLEMILSDPETMRFYPKPFIREEVLAWITRNISSYDENGFGLWAVELKDSRFFIGECGVTLQNIDKHIVPEIGYHFNKEFWHLGYASEAARGCLKYAFEVLHLDSIYIHTYVKNIPSQRVAEHLGMAKVKLYQKTLSRYNLVWPHVVYKMSKNTYELQEK